MRKKIALWLGGFTCMTASISMAADSYPVKPVSMVVGFPASGVSNGLARALAASLREQIGQAVVVENRPGAGTTIAASHVARSAPDGYTLFMQDMTTHAINAGLHENSNFDALKDFSTISLVAATPLVLVVNSNSPVRSLADLLQAAKAKPGSLAYGSSGQGSILHLTMEMLQKRTGAQLNHIPFNGATAAVMAMIGGHIDVTLATMPTALPLVQSGRIRPLGVTTATRSPALPEVPTFVEQGLSNFEVVLYSGVLGPAGLPDGVVDYLHQKISAAMATEDVKKYMSSLGADPIQATPAEFRNDLEKDIERYGRLIRDSIK